MKEKVKVEPEVGLIPQPKTMYWYVRSCMQTHRFKVMECEWIGGMSDLLRLAKGNVCLKKEDAESLCHQLNCRLQMLTRACENAHQKEQLEEEKARKKAEAAERKRIRDLEKKKLDKEAKKKAILQAEFSKKKKKSPHPDIIV